jgi:hypothetical protein
LHQLKNYAAALDNPPLLIVCDMERVRLKFHSGIFVLGSGIVICSGVDGHGLCRNEG